MIKLKKEKNEATPRLLYYVNQAFIDGNHTEPYHTVDIKNIFAERHHLSTLTADQQSQRPFFGCMALVGMILVSLFTMAISVLWEALISNYSLVSLAVLLCVILAMIACLWLTVKASIEAFRYNPKRVQALYNDWLKRGEIRNGQITGVKYDNKGKAHINYIFEGKLKKEIRGHFPVEYEIGSQSGGIVGRTIYILYADKKLHAPL